MIESYNNNLEWLRENSRLFIDQNIPLEIKARLINKGFKNIFDVYSLRYVGANDGKLLNLLKINKWILITYDKHFHKQALKYNKNMSILIKRTTENMALSPKTISNRIQNELIKNFRRIREYESIS